MGYFALGRPRDLHRKALWTDWLNSPWMTNSVALSGSLNPRVPVHRLMESLGSRRNTENFLILLQVINQMKSTIWQRENIEEDTADLVADLTQPSIPLNTMRNGVKDASANIPGERVIRINCCNLGWKWRFWFEIYEEGPSGLDIQIIWPLNTASTVSFTIPAATPDSDYLLRMKHIGLQVARSSGPARFYLSCAQITIRGGR
ncbi:hypothetical protein VE04_05862 [Pseudogymnoascus sp. 24MN13]|nr:hypothetical protein VE04_05862 [Pseudogymnoascus sp. 24MN13]